MLLVLIRTFYLDGCGPQWTPPRSCRSYHFASGTPPFPFVVSLILRDHSPPVRNLSNTFTRPLHIEGQHENMPLICLSYTNYIIPLPIICLVYILYASYMLCSSYMLCISKCKSEANTREPAGQIVRSSAGNVK